MVATMTINIDDNIARHFREVVAVVYGKGKGSLGKAVNEALQCWIEAKEKNEDARFKALLEKGHSMGKLKYKTRAELYDRSSGY